MIINPGPGSEKIDVWIQIPQSERLQSLEELRITHDPRLPASLQATWDARRPHREITRFRIVSCEKSWMKGNGMDKNGDRLSLLKYSVLVEHRLRQSE